MLLLVHRGMKEVETEGMADLLLTPQFYTMRREALPVKYAYQARRIAHSFFDGLIEQHEVYEYFVYKEEENWIFIAYDPQEVMSFLREKGISSEKIRKIFFAQQIASQLTKPVALGAHHVLTMINQVATVVPSSVLSESTTFQPSKIVLPKKGIHLDTGVASLISRKYLLMLSGMLLVFGIFWFVEGWRYGKNNSVLQEKLQRLYEAHPSLQNWYTRESIAGKYRKIDASERKKRNIVGKIASLLFKGITLTSFQMDQKRFKAILSVSGSGASDQLDRLIQKAGLHKSPASSGNMVVIEGRL